MEINWLAVVVAAFSAFVLGGLWFSPFLFQKVWMRASGVTEEEAAGGNPAKIFGLAFVFSLVMSANLAAFLADPGTDLVWGMTAGFLAGFGWVAMAIGIISLFERRPISYMLINGGYMVVALTVMGAILGGWR